MAYLCSHNSVDQLCSFACASAGNNQSACLNSCHSQMTAEKILSQCPVYVPSAPDTVFVPVAPGVCDSLTVMSPAVVDSLDRFFIDGLSGGVAFAFPMLAGLFFILLVSYILVSASKNS